MQEEVEQRIVVLIEGCAKFSDQELRKAITKLLQEGGNSIKKFQENQKNPHGQMTVGQLAAQNKGMQSIEVTDKNIGSFNHIARKYGIDFAPFKVKGENRYLVFFKSGDMDAMTAAFKEYTAKQLDREKRPSVLAKLQHFKEMLKSVVVDRTKKKERER